MVKGTFSWAPAVGTVDKAADSRTMAPAAAASRRLGALKPLVLCIDASLG
jgi:hypothetical protein